MLDLNGAPREYLYCRAWQHSWDHRGGDEPEITRVVRNIDGGNLAFWFTEGRCTSCGTLRRRYFQPKTCEPYNNWAYSHPPTDWKFHMYQVTQMDARRELARRLRVSARELSVVQEAS